MTPLVRVTFDDVAAVRARFAELVPGLEVIPSTDPRRVVVVGALAALHGIGGGSLAWSPAEASRAVSVALPRIPGASVLRAATSFLGIPLLTAAAGVLGGQFDHPCISTSPEAEATPGELLDTLCHEVGHLLQASAGGLAWCLKYTRAEPRILGAECPCYATTLFWRRALLGTPPADTAAAVTANLRAYGASDAQVADARRLLKSHEITIDDGLVPAIRTVIEAVRVLQARGVAGLPALPPSKS